MNLVEGKVCVVTGGGRGIGAAICEALGREGGHVVVGYGQSEEAARAVASRIVASGGRAEALRLEVRSPACATSLEEVGERLGRLDVLVNNAGITRDGLLISMTDEDWLDVLGTNLDGTMRCIRAAARRMLFQRSGSIINVSSIAARAPHKGQSNYAASKGAIDALTRALAVELGGRGIRVNAVAPGFVRTEMSAPVLARSEASIVADVPLRRIGEAAEIADTVLFLASELSRYTTGQVLTVDGGRTL